MFLRPFLILLLSVLAGFPISAGAQNNPYKIDDSLYPLYQRAFKERANKQGLLLADTLYAEAVKKGDKKAQCLAYTIPTFHYFLRDDFDDLLKATSKLKEISRKNNYLQYYYFGYINEIKWMMMRRANTLGVLQIVEEMKKDAFKDQYGYGILMCIRMQGEIYEFRKNYALAGQCYKEALDYMQKHVTGQDESPLYQQLASCNRSLENYPTALDYARKAYKVAKTHDVRMAALQEICQILYYMDAVEDLILATRSAYGKCRLMEWYRETS